MSARRLAISCLGISLAFVLATAGAFAQGPEVQVPATKPDPGLENSLPADAKVSYAAAERSFKAGEFTEAARGFERAYEQSQNPRLLVRVAAAEARLEHHARVAEFAKRFLREAGQSANARDVSDANALLESVKPFLAEVTFSVEPKGVSVFVDDQPIGRSPFAGPVTLELGSRRIRAVKAGHEEVTMVRELPGGTVTTIEIRLTERAERGRLRVTAGADDVISIDGSVVATRTWEGTLPVGLHVLEVSGKGKRPYRSEVAVQDKQAQSLTVTLDSDALPGVRDEPSLSWLWIAGGSALAVGAGVGLYFLLKPGEREPPPPTRGTLAPGVVPLSARF